MGLLALPILLQVPFLNKIIEDKIHGFKPATRAHDAKVLKITKTMGTTYSGTTITSSLESLANRVKALEQCGNTRLRETGAIVTQWQALQSKVNEKLEKLEVKISTKPERLIAVEKVWGRNGQSLIELQEIVERLQEELKNIQAW
ncbi:hypothetical protein HK101_011761 [Irineochytrium annulatum]|nr:hypothetical protein HK101_011761 [Irineochytrium annulatum]